MIVLHMYTPYTWSHILQYVKYTKSINITEKKSFK